MNQALGFGILGVGGILLTKAVTGSSFGDIVKGHPGSVSTTGQNLLSNGVAGVGQSLANNATATAGAASLAQAGAGVAKFSANQRTFASRLAADTGLNINVILAWMQNEQPPGSASAPNGTNNWLNIGSTDSGFYGGSNPAWSNPATAADQTAAFLKGGGAAGFGSASSGIRSILSTAGQSAASQIAAIQHSGWASSGYPDLGSIYQSIVGG